jgi:hypothetical protein
MCDGGPRLRRRYRTWLAGPLVFALYCGGAPTTVHAQCVGDCDGVGTVVVNNVITLVDIALGTASPSACTNGIPSGAEVTVAVIIQAVNSALNGCAFDVSGTWREDQYSLVSSDCTAAYTQLVFEQEISNPPVCDYQLSLSQNGFTVNETVECTGDSFVGTLDPSGTLQVHTSSQASASGCTIMTVSTDSVSLTHSPTAITGSEAVTFSGRCCDQSNHCEHNCTIVVQARWTKIQ